MSWPADNAVCSQCDAVLSSPQFAQILCWLVNLQLYSQEFLVQEPHLVKLEDAKQVVRNTLLLSTD